MSSSIEKENSPKIIISDSPAYVTHVVASEEHSIHSSKDIPRHVPSSSKVANPAPLGLAAFAASTFLLSIFNVQARGITSPNLIVGMALAYGGAVQILAGMWEFVCGNTFGATAFSSYGAFWISFGLIFIPGTGILEAYSTTNKIGQLENALGFYLLTWFIFTSILFLASFRTSVGLVVLFFFLDLTFLFLSIGAFVPRVEAVTKIGGFLGIFTAFIAWYVAAAGLLKSERSAITLPNRVLRPH